MRKREFAMTTRAELLSAVHHIKSGMRADSIADLMGWASLSARLTRFGLTYREVRRMLDKGVYPESIVTAYYKPIAKRGGRKKKAPALSVSPLSVISIPTDKPSRSLLPDILHMLSMIAHDKQALDEVHTLLCLHSPKQQSLL